MSTNALQHFPYYLEKWWWLVVLGGVIAAMAGYLVGVVSPGPYRATSMVIVSPVAGTDTPLNSVLASQRLASTYKELILTRQVLDDAASRLGGSTTAGSLRRKTTVSVVRDTQLIQISVSDDDPRRAASAANAMAQVFAEDNNVQSSDTRPGVVSVVENAAIPGDRQGPSLPLRTGLAALAGIAAALMIITFKTYLDRTVWDTEDLGELASADRFVSVLAFSDMKGSSAAGKTGSLPPLGRAHRTLATSVSAAAGPRLTEGRCMVIAVVSARRREGRTSVASRLAVGLALEGRRVTLVDFDLKHPSLHEEFHLTSFASGDEAQAAAAKGRKDAEARMVRSQREEEFHVTGAREQAQAPVSKDQEDGGARIIMSQREETPLEELDVVLCGGCVAERVSVREVHAFLNSLMKKEKEFILLDVPPMAEGAEAAILARALDAAVIVVEARRTTIDLVQSQVAQLAAIGVPTLGFVINKR